MAAQTKDPMNDVLTTQEAADLSGFSYRGFRKHVTGETEPTIKPDGEFAGSPYYLRSTVEAFMAKLTKQPGEYTLKEAVAYTGLPLSTLRYHLYETKKLQATRYLTLGRSSSGGAPKSPIFSKEDLDEFMAERGKKQEPTA